MENGPDGGGIHENRVFFMAERFVQRMDETAGKRRKKSFRQNLSSQKSQKLRLIRPIKHRWHEVRCANLSQAGFTGYKKNSRLRGIAGGYSFDEYFPIATEIQLR